MKTTMKSLSGPDMIRVLLIGRKTDNIKDKPDHKVDITNMTPYDVGGIIRIWDSQKICWEYQTTKSYVFPELDQGKEGKK